MKLPKKIEFIAEPDPSRPAGALDMKLAAETINGVIDYLSEKEQASEEMLRAAAIGFKMLKAKPQEASEENSFGNSTTPGFQSKPQEEPRGYKWDLKKLRQLGMKAKEADEAAEKESEPKELEHNHYPIGTVKNEHCKACKKESEPKEKCCNWSVAHEHGDDGNVYTLERGPERYIHLEKPANMSIGESLYEFYNWYDDKRDASIAGEANGIGEALEHLEVMSDETFLKLWQEWISTKK